MANEIYSFNPAPLLPVYPGSKETNFQFMATQTLARGTVLGQVTASKKLVAYSDVAVDGSQRAIGILKYDIKVDAAGKIAFGTNTAVGDRGQLELYAPVYRKGAFKTSELVGLDAAAVVDLGRLEAGTVADGILALI